MSLRLRHLLALLLALLAAGCGDDEREGEGLPRSAVSELEARLDQVDRRYTFARNNDSPGACADIESDSFPAIERILSGLPEDVDPDVRQATEDSFERLRELTSEDCADVEPPPETETTPPETDIETAPPPPPPPRTETTPPRTQTTPPAEEEQDQNNGNDSGGTPPGQGGGGTGAPQSGDEE